MHSGTGLASALLDVEGDLAEALAAMWREVEERFDRLAFRIDARTHPRTIDLAMRLGARVRVSARGLDEVGRERRGAVADVRAAGADVVVAGDLDHILRWIRAAPDELTGAVGRVRAGEVDCLVVGRPAAAFAQAPAPLRETERLVNLAYERLTGHAWDLLSSVRVLSIAAADLIVETGEADTLGSDVEWPLLCERAGGLVVDYYEAPHLSYVEGNALDAAPAEPDDPGPPGAWLTRLRICGWMADAMAPYL